MPTDAMLKIVYKTSSEGQTKKKEFYDPLETLQAASLISEGPVLPDMFTEPQLVPQYDELEPQRESEFEEMLIERPHTHKVTISPAIYGSPYGRSRYYGGAGTTLAISGTILVAVTSAAVINWKRNPELSGGVRFLKAWGASIIWLPYLIYVGIDKLTGDD